MHKRSRKKHEGKGVSKQFGDSTGNGRQTSGGMVSGGMYSAKAMQGKDASNMQQRQLGHPHGTRYGKPEGSRKPKGEMMTGSYH